MLHLFELEDIKDEETLVCKVVTLNSASEESGLSSLSSLNLY